MQGYPGGGPYAPPGQGQGFVPPQGGGGGMGRLQLHTSFFPLAWVLFFVKTGVAIDGQPQTKPWGTSYYDLPAGTHHIKVHFNYLFGPAGIGQREFQIYPGHTTRLSYSAPIFIFMSGTISEGGTEPIAQLPPGPGHY